MAILKILTIPDLILKCPCPPVKEITPDIEELISNLIETIHSNKHCVGIAAPQVGKLVRLIVVDASLHHKPCPNNGLITLINPVITTREGKQMCREGCLSIPEFTGNVLRSQSISVEGLDRNGKIAKIATSGFESVVIQHEIDHLDGVLFLDRVSSLKTDVFRRKLFVPICPA